ncbi:hypothetical protein MLD38_002981 [Melastoma candidum]|uniref:Uncharacterized protein n=1 Tax=Melastoma candidum TaxID=119954 RepID=A0ACB9S152_9MYRT|nr:hypothetical protein MLD38_002981 [Melastoma candidum]
MDMVDHVEEEGLVVGLLRRQQGGTGTPRKRPDEDGVVEVDGAGAGKDLQVQVSGGNPSTKDVVLDVELEEDDDDGALEETYSRNISGVRGYSGNERRQVEAQGAGETEYDVENVLEKQNTHNLFCPNCKSCITRRVILRRIRDEVIEERKAFRCLSCLSFLFPIGNCWGDPEPSLTPGGNKLGDDPATTNADVSTKPTTDSPEDVENPAMDSDKKVAPIDEGSSAPGISDPSAKTQPDDVTAVMPSGQARELDIIKSIVYGGLIESITSLGIVSSAAGGAASTLNILALALANLFGGLIVIAQNLRELKNQQPSTTATGETQDQYTELLGNRRHILLHATIVILSFIVFGAVAPVTYAFSFRKSDSRDYKLAAMAGASLFCILLLAMGKAYVRRSSKTYFKTILYYLSMGVAASGSSFLLGELFDYLLQKLGWFSSTASVSGPWLVSVPTQYGTASY